MSSVPTMQIGVEVELITAKRIIFATPCRGQLVCSTYKTIDGERVRTSNLGLFRRRLDNGLLDQPCVIRDYKVKEVDDGSL